MSNFKKFSIILAVACGALVLQFGLQRGDLAYILVAVGGGIVSINMFVGMLQTLKSGKYGVDILAITAIVSTLWIGDYWASLMILLMLTGGDSLEDYANRQASRELQSLLDNSPKIAHLISGEKLIDVAVEDLKIGDHVLVKPKEMVPIDGKLFKGVSQFDESSLTGESRPVEKEIGEILLSGSINSSNAVWIEVIALAEDSQYQQLVKLVRTSTDNPSPFVRMADRYAIPFTLAAYAIGGLAWLVSGDPVRFAQVMVVASPCPLILAAPVALVAGMSRASRQGVIVKMGATLEKLAQVRTVAFDKTGTITQGNLSVDYIVPHQISQEELLSYAASVEQGSSHVMARSLVAYCKENEIAFQPVSQLKEITGQGVEGICQGHRISVGKMSMISSLAEEYQTNQTSVYIAKDGVYIGHIIFKDNLRSEAKETIAALKELEIANLVMLTGDRQVTADHIAKEVGITKVLAECLPQDKISYLDKLSDAEKPVVMVGDGVNDAPALTRADVGIAMGAHGDTVASESADVVILKDDLSTVSQVIAIAQRTMTVARQSVLIGLFVCIFLMVVAATGVIPTLLGAALQEVIDTVSILSALRAKYGKNKLLSI